MNPKSVTGLTIPQLLCCSRENSSGEGRRTFCRAHGRPRPGASTLLPAMGNSSKLPRLLAKGSTGRSTLWPQAQAPNRLPAVLLAFASEIGALRHAVRLGACVEINTEKASCISLTLNSHASHASAWPHC